MSYLGKHERSDAKVKCETSNSNFTLRVLTASILLMLVQFN